MRNWGYFDKVLRIIIDLYAPLDSAIKAKLGLSATEIVSAFLAHLRSFEKQNTKTLLALRQIWRSRTAKQRIREYYKLYPELQDNPEDLIALVAQHGLDANQAMGLIWAHLDFRATEQSILDSRAVATALGADAGAVVLGSDGPAGELRLGGPGKAAARAGVPRCAAVARRRAGSAPLGP